jgi:hypothetical protein
VHTPGFTSARRSNLTCCQLNAAARAACSLKGETVIDFDALVLDKTVDVFGIAVKFTFEVSAPGTQQVARGVYSSTPVDVQMQDETIFSDQQTSLGIRIRDFLVPPDRGDAVEIIDTRHPAYGQKYWIGDSDLDGQGGATLLLRTQYQPPDAP